VTESQASRSRSVDLGPNTNYVADTGPLLCLGAKVGKPLRDIVKNRCHGKAHWVEAVRAELTHQSKGIGPRAEAARAYNGRGASWLTAVVPFTDADDQALNPIWDDLKRLAASKQRTNQPTSSDPRMHLGEAQCILHASRHGHTLLAHDNDAHRVAKRHGVPAATLVDLARHLVTYERASPRQLANGFLALQQDAIDTGEHITGPLDLTPRKRPPIPAQRPGNG
jgi:hypothetical protein